MTEPTITCPNCKTEIKLTESLAAPLIQATRKQFEEKLNQKDAEVAQREAELRLKENQVADAKRQLDQQVAEQVASKLQQERTQIIAEESRKAKQASATEIEAKARELADLQEVLKARDEKLAEAQKAQAELIKKQRELDDAKRELELTVEKRVQDSLSEVRNQAKLQAEEEQKFKVMEKEQTIAAMQKQIEDLKRRAEQGSQQLQGEVQELELENLLRVKFPFDTIEPVGKGEFGGDVIQRVFSQQGQASGTILWESKRTKNWSDAWLTKLREDQRTAKAEIAVIVSQVLPKDVDSFDIVDGVWVTHPKAAISLMQSRIEVLWRLLTVDGFLAVQIDDNEFARLYLLMAEICGESNIKVICVKMSEPTGVKMASINKVGGVAKLKEYILLAGKSGVKNLTLEKIPKEKWDKEYKTLILNVSEDELSFIKNVLNSDLPAASEELDKITEIGYKASFISVSEYSKKEGIKITEEWLFANAWRIVQFATLTGGALQLAIEKKRNYGGNPPSFFPLITKTGVLYCIKGEFNEETSLPRSKLLFADEYLQVHAGDFWSDIKTTGLDNEGNVDFKNGKKPEKLIKRILGACTKVGDIVLDSFGGSGTTAAVAHKMGRRWIMVELGEHCHTHIIPRLQKVIDGEDQGGISQAVNWKGGGGFRYYSLAPSLLQQDQWSQWVINKEYNADMLAAAICKLEGFTFQPSSEHYWQHGFSTENDFIYVTTQTLTADQLQALSEEVGPDRTLLVCCAAFRADESRFSNLTIKKIPKMVLSKCEWGHDDYSLNVQNLPQAPKEPVSASHPSTGSGRTANANQVGLFGEDDGGAA